MVSRKAAHTPGSATGVLPVGKPVPLGPLLKALIMISANDAAVALAEHDSGSTAGFVARMNQRARSMGLGCTRFSTPNGSRTGQPLLRARSGGARPSGPRQPADRRDRQDAIRETAVPDQGTAAAPREQPLLPLPWIEGSRWRAGDRPEDGLDRRRGPLLRDHGQAGWSPPRRGVARLARPDQAGAGAAPSGVRCRRSGTRARSSTAREEVMARSRELAPASNRAARALASNARVPGGVCPDRGDRDGRLRPYRVAAAGRREGGLRAHGRRLLHGKPPAGDRATTRGGAAAGPIQLASLVLRARDPRDGRGGGGYSLKSRARGEWLQVFTNVGVAGVWAGIAVIVLLVVAGEASIRIRRRRR